MTKNNNLENRELLSAKDIMEILGLGQNTAYNIIHQLPTVNIGGKKCTRKDLNAYIEKLKEN